MEYADGRVVLEPIRFVAVYSNQLAQQHAQAASMAHTQEAQELVQPITQVEARRFACEADAEAAIAEYEGYGSGRRGRPPCRWRSHTVQYQVQPAWQRKERPRRGRPRQGEAVEEELVYRLAVTAEALAPPVATFGWLVLATTIDEQTCGDAEIVRAYRDQTTTVEPGFRWIKTPAAISPIWLPKPEWIAALAMLTVVGLLVYALIQRQVRQYLQLHHQRVPGNKGETALPTAAVVLTLFAHVTMVHLELADTEMRQVHGWQGHHRLICDALGVDPAWYDVSVEQKNNSTSLLPP